MDTESSQVLHKNKRGQRVASESKSDAAAPAAAAGSGKVDWSKVEELDVLLRPWLRIDGSLNRRVFDRLLGAVLGQECNRENDENRQPMRTTRSCSYPIRSVEILKCEGEVIRVWFEFQIMQRPGQRIAHTSDRFSPALQPVHCRDLVDFLAELGCVSLFRDVADD